MMQHCFPDSESQKCLKLVKSFSFHSNMIYKQVKIPKEIWSDTIIRTARDYIKVSSALTDFTILLLHVCRKEKELILVEHVHISQLFSFSL